MRRTVGEICRHFRALSARVRNVNVDTDVIFQGRTSIECVQILLAFIDTNPLRTMNGDTDFIISSSTEKCVISNDYLGRMLDKQKGVFTNAQITKHVNHMLGSGSARYEGCCFALTYLACRAFLMGQLAPYVDRAHALTCIGPYQLEAFLAALKKMIGRLHEACQAYIREEACVDIRFAILQNRLDVLRTFHTDLLAFLDVVMLLQEPSTFGAVIGADESEQHRYPALSMVGVLNAEVLHESVEFFHVVDIYRQCDFVKHLEFLANTLHVSDRQHFTVNLRLHEHRISIHYLAVAGGRWLLQDSNHMPGIVYINTLKERARMVATMYRRFIEGDDTLPVVFSSHLFCSEVDEKTFSDRMWLYHTLYGGYIALDECAAERRRNNDVFGQNLMTYGVDYDYPASCQLAVNSGFNVNDKVNKRGDTALGLACKRGSENAVKYLIAIPGINLSKASEHADGRTPIAYARSQGFRGIARLILNALQAVTPAPTRRPPPRPRRQAPPMLAVPRIFQSSESGRLIEACRLGDVKEVMRLIAAAVDVNRLDSTGESPLTIACNQQHVEVVRVLLEAGADPNIARLCDDRMYPLHIAYQKDDDAIASLLLMHGADRQLKAGAKSPASMAKHLDSALCKHH
ncbi:MAG: ankyrin repeat domain-containing protein [Coxiellaceae bacterium]|nr:ankyrin repeat domain-containing protein [Coxiellaceae bacterium]